MLIITVFYSYTDFAGSNENSPALLELESRHKGFYDESYLSLNILTKMDFWKENEEMSPRRRPPVGHGPHSVSAVYFCKFK